MGIATSVGIGGASRGRRLFALWLALGASMGCGASEAQQGQFRPAAKFEGKTIPEPPEQGKPWTAPETKLPKFLVNATAALFEQGVPDPRGCAYREVEFRLAGIVKGRGFVLPERADAPGRFAIGWDGLVYPLVTVGEPIDLVADMKALAAHFKKVRAEAQPRRYWQGVGWGFFPRQGQSYFDVAGVEDFSPIKLCLLLRLGRADLAETLFAANTNWTPEPRARDLTNYGISYLSLATDWAGSAFKRLITLHVRGEDVLALDTARKLAKFRDLATAKADAMGFPRPDRQQRSILATADDPIPRFHFLGQLDALLRDQERRAKLPPRGPIPRKGTDPAARVAALLRDLDQIDEQQMSSFGGASPGNSPMVGALAAEGDAAVPPLLAVLESDDRLTRSVSNSRGDSIEKFVHPVYEAAFAALISILRTGEFERSRLYGWKSHQRAERKALADSIRQYWQKTRAIPIAERWYRTLLDDSAGPKKWLEAAGGISHSEYKPGMPQPRPETPAGPLAGEPLRAGRDPSVTALMIRRVQDLKRSGDAQAAYDQGFNGACAMALNLAAWEPAAALPVIVELSKECRSRSDRWRAQQSDGWEGRSYGSFLVQFTQIRAKVGDLAALDEYADWLRTTTPKVVGTGDYEIFQPLLDHRARPSMASAARWLFNDSKSPWVPLVAEARRDQAYPFQNLFASPLIVIPEFRDGVLAGLADRTVLGTIQRDDRSNARRKVKGLPDYSFGGTNLDVEGAAIGVEHPLRTCDIVAWNLASLEGFPRFNFFWPEPRRDEAVAAFVAFLKKFGPRFSTELPPSVRDFPGPRAHIMFPTLAKPATPADVAAARAIFSLEGEGEARLVNLPALPLKARWVTLKDTPVEGRTPDGVTHRRYDTDGYVWQAEEVRKGDRWERSYGFVGHHVVARAPASEIEFASEEWRWWNLSGGLDAQAALTDPQKTGYEPGRPIPITLQIRNRLGVARSSPTEFARPAPDGKPALRKGVSLSLWYSEKMGPDSGMNRAYPNDPIRPKRDAHFDPGDASRPLDTLESFEALRFDPSDWFDLSKPGSYRLRMIFAADSGLGEGSASEVYFRVGGED